MSTPAPFRLSIRDASIIDLRERLARTRFADQVPDAPWAYGTDPDHCGKGVSDEKFFYSRAGMS